MSFLEAIRTGMGLVLGGLLGLFVAALIGGLLAGGGAATGVYVIGSVIESLLFNGQVQGLGLVAAIITFFVVFSKVFLGIVTLGGWLARR